MPRKKTNKYINKGEYSILCLKNGDEYLVDNEDVNILKKYSWFNNGNGYAASKGVDGKIFLHRLVLNADENCVVDHINFNKFDNRKNNLRVCTQSENIIHQRTFEKLKGVYLNKKTNKYYIHLTVNGKAQHFGTYDNETMAKNAYNRLAEEYYKEYAVLNT